MPGLACRGHFFIAQVLLAVAAECSAQTLTQDGKSAAAPDVAASESTAAGILPEAANAAVDPSAKARDIGRGSQPWLRINSPGHTAAVQALAFTPDSRRLCSAGLDKVVQVWDLSALPANAQLRDVKRTFVRERTIHWQISRGPRGSLFALACAPNDGLLALGGYGAMGSTGEILLVNPVDGTLVKVLEGHRQTVCSLTFSLDGNTLVSVDTDGECRAWRRGLWDSTALLATDTKTYGPATAALIQRQPLLRPVAVAGNAEIILPVYTTVPGAAKLEWQLQRFALENRKVVGRLQGTHVGLVTSLAASRDGHRLASADLDGNLYLWDLRTGGRPVRLASGSVVKSLAFSPDGKSLATGSAVSAANGSSLLQFWNVAAQKLASSRSLPDHVHACAYSPDGTTFAYVGGFRNEVFIERLSVPAKTPVALAGGSRKILKVAFAAESPFHRVAFGTKYRQGGVNDSADLDESFDPTRGQLGKRGPVEVADWLPSNWLCGNWNARRSADLRVLQLFEGGVARGAVQLDSQTQGLARCSCWIPNDQGKPVAIAVGTDKQNMVCIFGLRPRGICPLLRQFRGHQDFVTSLAVSRDLRFLVSGSADGTLQFWSLSELQQEAGTVGRWGASLNVAGGDLVVQTINEAGPLFRKGLRRGDSIKQIRWHDGQQERTETMPQAMLDRLRDVPWQMQIEFGARHADGLPIGFQLVPAWQALASLYVSDDREWAFWTPEGYYDASANGHTLFGWQVNRGLQKLPQFYRADQFRRTLERPDVLQQLLSGGSLESALRNAKEAAAVGPEQILVAQIEATPTVAILSPRPGDVIRDRKVKVRARITVPPGGNVSQTRVFANGVVARQPQLVSRQIDAATGGHELVYEWDAALPNETRNMIQLFVLTDAQTTAFERVLVEQSQLPPLVPGRLYILAIGVNNYRDSAIEDLDYPVADAESLVAAFQTQSHKIYEMVPPIVLTNESVTRARWQSTFVELTERLKDAARPDDLLVIFMAGHGEVDPRTQVYHYICQDAHLDTLLTGSETISWDDFRLMADIPCRKLVLLDTCHSGAIQGVRQQHKQATREFQENLVFTVAAAADDEASQERTEWRHGAFTKSLLEGLAGAADESHDGVVTLNELVTYANWVVPKLTSDAQHPIAAPEELFEYVSLPLSRGSRPALPHAEAASSVPVTAGGLK
jgi:WD40 repeat protein